MCSWPGLLVPDSFCSQVLKWIAEQFSLAVNQPPFEFEPVLLKVEFMANNYFNRLAEFINDGHGDSLLLDLLVLEDAGEAGGTGIVERVQKLMEKLRSHNANTLSRSIARILVHEVQRDECRLS